MEGALSRRLRMRRGVLAAFLVLTGAIPATADAIDGNWCHPDGRRFSIRGPAITTPAGNHLQGNYDRHYFSYQVPVTEPRAGETVFMLSLIHISEPTRQAEISYAVF